MNNEGIDKHKTNKNISKLSKRFYFQVLLFLIVTCVHFLVTPIFEDKDLFADSNRILLTLLTPGIILTSLIGIPEFLFTRLLASLLYGLMGALLFSQKTYLIVISIILIFTTIIFSYIIFWNFAIIATG